MTEEQDDFIDQLLSHGPSQGTLFLAFRKMKEEGRLSDALKNCLKAVNSYPDDIRLRTLLTESYLEEGFIGLAEAECNIIVSQISRLVSVYKLQAEMFMKQQRYDEAYNALRIYLAHNPDDEEMITLLASIEKAREESADETSLALEEVIPSEKDFEEAPEWAAVADAGEIEKEREEAPAELETPTLAEIYFNQGQILEAINTYEVVLSINPGDDASAKRLAELKRMAELKGLIAEKAEKIASDENIINEKRRKAISTLETWLSKIRELEGDR